MYIYTSAYLQSCGKLSNKIFSTLAVSFLYEWKSKTAFFGRVSSTFPWYPRFSAFYFFGPEVCCPYTIEARAPFRESHTSYLLSYFFTHAQVCAPIMYVDFRCRDDFQLSRVCLRICVIPTSALRQYSLSSRYFILRLKRIFFPIKLDF